MTLPAGAQPTPRPLEHFAAAMPQAVGSMQRQPLKGPSPQSRVVADYEGDPGIARIVIRPAPPPPPGGRTLERGQGEVFIILGEDMRRGTNKLGAEYETHLVQSFILKAANTRLICGHMERTANGPAAPDDPLQVMTRSCVAFLDGMVVALWITSLAYRSEAPSVAGDQMAFMVDAIDEIMRGLPPDTSPIPALP